MTTQTISTSARTEALPGQTLARMKEAAPPLFWVGFVLLAISCLTLLLTLVDTRLFQGVSVWVKPWKFQVSIGVYLLTLALFMTWLPAAALRTRWARYVVWVAVASGLFEIAYITWQAAFGLGSHFNFTTTLSTVMYQLMGVGAVLLTSASLVLGILIARSADYRLPGALKLSIVLGLLITFVLGTSFGAYLSSQPTGNLVGGQLSQAGGLFLFNWSRISGDYRVAHFFGIHAMHFIPLFGLVLAGLRTPPPLARASVWGFSVLFSVLCIWTFIQARMGQPFWS
jgi:hypothetical protein